MTSQSQRTKAKQQGGFLARLLRCRRGVAAVEFGYIAPIMLLMLLGALEFSRAITIDRRVTQVASSTADIIARQTQVTSTDLNGFMQIIAQLMAPYNSDDLRLTVSSVYADPADATQIKICWSYNRSVTIAGNPTDKGAAAYTNGQSYTGLPTGLIGAGESVIMVEVQYDYTPLVKNLLGINWNSDKQGTWKKWSYMQNITTLSETFYLKPRLSSSVEKSDESLSCV